MVTELLLDLFKIAIFFWICGCGYSQWS